MQAAFLFAAGADFQNSSRALRELRVLLVGKMDAKSYIQGRQIGPNSGSRFGKFHIPRLVHPARPPCPPCDCRLLG
jgi:hypothetical protein